MLPAPTQLPATLARRRRRQRGQATIETVMAVLLLSLIFFGTVQLVYLYIAQLIAHHTSFVTARSYVVGFEDQVVSRAMEVGAIGLAGHLTYPDTYINYDPLALSVIEPELIRSHLGSTGYTIYYQYWDRIVNYLPVTEFDDVVPISIRVFDYPVDMPMRQAYMNSSTVDISSTTRLMNHAAYFLQ